MLLRIVLWFLIMFIIDYVIHVNLFIKTFVVLGGVIYPTELFMWFVFLVENLQFLTVILHS